MEKLRKNIVFVQCVGSRCSDDRGKSYCSKICCMYTAKHAMLIRDKYPDVNVTVFYIDVRTPGIRTSMSSTEELLKITV